MPLWMCSWPASAENSSIRAFTSCRVIRSRAAIEARSTWSTTPWYASTTPSGTSIPRSRCASSTAIQSRRSSTILCSGDQICARSAAAYRVARTLGTVIGFLLGRGSRRAGAPTGRAARRRRPARCRCGAGRRRTRRGARRCTPRRGRRRGRRPVATTARTRPPAVTRSPSGECGAGVDDVDALDRLGVVEAADGVAGRGGLGVAAAGDHDGDGGARLPGGRATSASVPVAAASRSCASEESSSASSAWVSGSPKRALNSTTRVPRWVSARPAYSRPANGVPRRAISSTVGWSTVAQDLVDEVGGRPRQRRVGAHAAGVGALVAVADRA